MGDERAAGCDRQDGVGAPDRAARLKVYEKTVAAGLREVFTHECDSHALQTAKAARLAEVAAEFDALIAAAEARRNEALAHLRSLGETPTTLAQATELKARDITRRIAAAKAAREQTANAAATPAAKEDGGDLPAPREGRPSDTDSGADRSGSGSGTGDRQPGRCAQRCDRAGARGGDRRDWRSGVSGQRGERHRPGN